jgi:hypothetical protein
VFGKTGRHFSLENHMSATMQQTFTLSLDPEVLEQRLNDVLNFALDHLQKLPTHSPHWAEEKTEGDDAVRFEDKVLAETAILVFLTARIKNLREDTRQLLDRVVEALEIANPRERSTGMLLRCPYLVPALGLPQIILNRMGRGDPELQEIVERIFAADLAETFERTPFRALEVRWIQSILRPDAELKVSDLIPLNVLLKPVHPIMLNRTTAYAMTHGVMYATDFGLKPALNLESEVDIPARIDATLAWLLVNEDLDLLIEFIIAITVLQKEWSPYVWAAWNLFNDVWDELGFLPSLSLNPAEYAQLENDAAAAYAFRHVYHTTYVGGLLCAILLTIDRTSITRPWTAPNVCTASAAEACLTAANRGRVFISAPPNGHHLPDPQFVDSPDLVLSRVVPLLSDLVPENRFWRKTLLESDLDPAVRAQILGDGAIIHAARKYELPKLLQSLNAMITLPRPPSLTLVEGAMFLVRQQFKDGCIGTQFVTSESRKSEVAQEATSVISECLEAYSARFACGADITRLQGGTQNVSSDVGPHAVRRY